MTLPRSPRRPIKFGLVDPIRTSASLLEELARRRLEVCAIESGLVGPLTNMPCETVPAADSLDEMVSEVRRRGITHLVGCVDPSILYADRLCAQAGLAFNGLRRSEARRNKRLMAQAVSEAGVRVPRYLETRSLSELRQWVGDHPLPVVVKPVCSGGSDNVHECASYAQVEAAFEAILDARNLMGAVNANVLAQEFIEGVEYAVDCVSFEGRHVLTDCFRYQKGRRNGRSFVYEKETFLDRRHEVVERLFRTAGRALDALDFFAGPSHMELKIAPDGDIVFLEVGPRLSGGDTYKLVQDLRQDGLSQVPLAVDSWLGESAPSSDYVSIAHGVRSYVIARTSGKLAGFRGLDAIRALPSFRRAHMNVKEGDSIVPTTDFSNYAGWFDLVNADADALRRDELALDRLLQDDVLVVARSTEEVALHVLLVGGHDETFCHFDGLPLRFTVLHLADAIGPRLRALTEDIHIIDTLDTQCVLAKVRDVHGRDPVGYVFSFTEDGLLPAATAAMELGIDGLDLDATRLCIDKPHMRRRLAGTEFEVAHRSCADSADAVRFLDAHPAGIILKTSAGAGSENVFVARSVDEVRRIHASFELRGDVALAEEFLPGRMLSVETLTLRGQHEVVTITGTHLREGTLIPEHHVVPAPHLTDDDRARLEAFCLRLLSTIGYKHGPCHIEVKLTPERVRLIEINNRVGGDGLGLLAEKTTGINMFRETLEFASKGVPSDHARASRTEFVAGASRSFFKPVNRSTVAALLVDVSVLRNYLPDDQPVFHSVRSTDDRIGPVLFVSNDLEAFGEAVRQLHELTAD